jgi:hypothetical protein
MKNKLLTYLFVLAFILPIVVSTGNMFIAAPYPIPRPTLDHSIVRHRYVTLNQAALGLLPKANRVTFNLFPDVKYIGVVTKKGVDGGAYYYTGYLLTSSGTRIENGYFYIVKNSTIYIMHIASPAGIYEVNYFKGKVYRVTQLQFMQQTD